MKECKHKFVTNKKTCLNCSKSPEELFPADEKDVRIDELEKRVADLECRPVVISNPITILPQPIYVEPYKHAKPWYDGTYWGTNGTVCISDQITYSNTVPLNVAPNLNSVQLVG